MMMIIIIIISCVWWWPPPAPPPAAAAAPDGHFRWGLDYFNDGSQFATAGKDRLLRVYDEATKRQVMTLQGGDMKERYRRDGWVDNCYWFYYL